MNLNQTIEAARNVLRFKHMAYKTEKSYLGWIRRFAFWCRDNPGGNHEDKVRGFLTHLARERDVSASTQSRHFTRRARNFSFILLQWAANARRRAMEINTSPVQGDLFGGKP